MEGYKMRIGITGHQNFENHEWVEAGIINELSNVEATHGFSSLAVGADQLFARLLAQRAIPYTVIVPSAHYEDTFETPADLANYNALLDESSSRIVLNNDKPSEQAFYDAGQRVVDESDMVIAVWNGKPAKGLGGTADMVKYAEDNSKSVVHLNPDTKEIKRYER
jgi:hypothetical protein